MYSQVSSVKRYDVNVMGKETKNIYILKGKGIKGDMHHFYM